MAPALLTCLPTMQLVCSCLVITEDSITNGTTPNANISSSATPTQALPPDYVAHHEFGVAYKVYGENVTWHVANARCAREGAYLATIDSVEKIELVKRQLEAQNQYVHVGFHLIGGNDKRWHSVYTGLPVLTTLPWRSGEPDGNGSCAKIHPSQTGLTDNPCNASNVYVCQISIPAITPRNQLIGNAQN